MLQQLLEAKEFERLKCGGINQHAVNNDLGWQPEAK